ncbi:MAG: nuclear transport factor 2 family protein [Holophagaceae bacterium]|nr:nuclear transport factor 2 family protein [Holophagaceae bacterium]
MRQIILMALTLCSLAACKQGSPEDQVRKTFAEAVQAVENSDVGGASELLAQDFQGPEGIDRGAARLYLMGVFRQQKVGVTVLANRVQITRDGALQAVDLVLTSKGGGLIPEDMGRRSYVIRWRKTGNDWKIRSVESAGPNP